MAGLFDSVGALQGALSFHRARQMVLAGNVANVDTPGYKPLDLERVGGGSTQQAGGVRDSYRVFEDSSGLQDADGNAVNLERELAKVDANRVRFNTASALVSRRIALLKYAAADGIG